jgi:chromosome segregation ATPase
LESKCASLLDVAEQKSASQELSRSREGEIRNLQQVAVLKHCKSLEDELGILRQEKSALETKCASLQRIEEEKRALEEHCKSLTSEVEVTIQAAVHNEQNIRGEMQQRIQSLLQENLRHHKLLLDEKDKLLHVESLFSDYELQYADDVYHKTEQIKILEAEIQQLKQSKADVSNEHLASTQLCKSLEEKITLLTSINSKSQNESQLLTDALTSLRLSLETSQRRCDALDLENSRLSSSCESLTAALSQSREEKAALSAKLESLSNELLLLLKIRHQEPAGGSPIPQQNAFTPQHIQSFSVVPLSISGL